VALFRRLTGWASSARHRGLRLPGDEPWRDLVHMEVNRGDSSLSTFLGIRPGGR
jgi:hypothetical protein